MLSVGTRQNTPFEFLIKNYKDLVEFEIPSLLESKDIHVQSLGTNVYIKMDNVTILQPSRRNKETMLVRNTVNDALLKKNTLTIRYLVDVHENQTLYSVPKCLDFFYQKQTKRDRWFA